MEHNEIMTKWFYSGKRFGWVRVLIYKPDTKEYGVPIGDFDTGLIVQKDWFDDKESATIPPEATK